MRLKKAFSVALALVLVLAVCSSALAQNDVKPTGIASKDTYFTDEYTISSSTRSADLMYTPTLSISSPSTGKITVDVRVSAKKVVDKLGFTVLSIEQWSGSSWVPVATWTNKYAYGTDYFSWTGNATGCQSGASYRVSCTFYAKLGTQTQEIPATTSYITCR